MKYKYIYVCLLATMLFPITGCSVKIKNQTTGEENIDTNIDTSNIDENIDSNTQETNKSIVYATNDFSYYENSFEENIANEKSPEEINTLITQIVENNETTQEINVENIINNTNNEANGNANNTTLPPSNNNIFTLDNIKAGTPENATN